jgi:hypothetical protein
MLQLLASAPMAAGFAWTPLEAADAHQHAQAARQAGRAGLAFKPKFFTAHEYGTVRVLTDLIIPRDERSGSATDAGVPEFMDFMMLDQPDRQTAMRGGLAWLDLESQKRFEKTFVGASDAERRRILDDIAWPARTDPKLAHGAAFFTSFRDLTATGFWTSRVGIDDLRYVGNTFLVEWNGCPDEAMQKLGVAEPKTAGSRSS